jgi:hypothetical protein
MLGFTFEYNQKLCFLSVNALYYQLLHLSVMLNIAHYYDCETQTSNKRAVPLLKFVSKWLDSLMFIYIHILSYLKDASIDFTNSQMY